MRCARRGATCGAGPGGMLRVSALPSLALDALPTAVARFLRRHQNVKFDLQTVHHDDLLRKLYERETDIAIAYEVPPAMRRWAITGWARANWSCSTASRTCPMRRRASSSSGWRPALHQPGGQRPDRPALHPGSAAAGDRAR